MDSPESWSLCLALGNCRGTTTPPRTFPDLSRECHRACSRPGAHRRGASRAGPIRDGVWRAEDPSGEVRLHDLYSVGEPVDAFENAIEIAGRRRRRSKVQDDLRFDLRLGHFRVNEVAMTAFPPRSMNPARSKSATSSLNFGGTAILSYDQNVFYHESELTVTGSGSQSAPTSIGSSKAHRNFSIAVRSSPLSVRYLSPLRFSLCSRCLTFHLTSPHPLPRIPEHPHPRPVLAPAVGMP